MLSVLDMHAVREEEALMNTAGCDGTSGPLSASEATSHLVGVKPPRGISFTLDQSFSLFLAAKKLHPGVQKPPRRVEQQSLDIN